MPDSVVFFGPWAGELGWEFMHWHAWVNELCQGPYRNHRKIVSTYPGRACLYPHADEYWFHPSDLTALPISSRNYISDYWENTFPRNYQRRKSLVGRLLLGSRVPVSGKPVLTDIGSQFEKLFRDYRSRLPKDTEYFCPFHLFEYEGNRIGVERIAREGGEIDFQPHAVPIETQKFFRLRPPEEAERFLDANFQITKPVISIFPRFRQFRRADKNWSREKYVELIDRINEEMDCHVAILGAPGGSFFVDDPPVGVIDLINIPDSIRLDAHVAILQRSKVALGSLSGALLVAMAAGCPALTWAWRSEGPRFHRENFLKTPAVYHPLPDPPVLEILELAKELFNESLPLTEKFDSEIYLIARRVRSPLFRLLPNRLYS